MTYRSRLLTWFPLVLVVVLLASCSGAKTPCTGGERCVCYANGTCNVGLSCHSNLCVNVSDAGSDSVVVGVATGGASGSGGAGGIQSDGSVGAGGIQASGSGGAGGIQPSGSGGGIQVSGAGGAGGIQASGSGGAGGIQASGAGGAGVGGTGAPSDGGVDAPGSGGTDGGNCRLFEVFPQSTVPTVFLLVDRSGSMFDCLPSAGACPSATSNAWTVLKDGILQVVQQLQGQVRFGFGAFTGENLGVCPMFDQVPASLDNYSRIAALYGSLVKPAKGETPAVSALAMVKALLDADPSSGRKYILFVTDGEPDYCNDGNPICAYDGVVGQLQRLHTEGITTLVFGLQSPLTTIAVPTLQAFANAGDGQSVLALGTPADIYYQCMATQPSWLQEHTLAGRPALSALGVYGANGNATLYRPDPTNPPGLTDLFAKAISNVKSCNFDLANGLRVDLTQLDQASVLIQGTAILRDATNGWRMVSETRLQLSGAACDTWRQPGSRSIDFRFPCGVVHM